MYFSRKLNGIATTWPVPVRGRRVATAASRSDSAIFAQEADLLLSANVRRQAYMNVRPLVGSDEAALNVGLWVLAVARAS